MLWGRTSQALFASQRRRADSGSVQATQGGDGTSLERVLGEAGVDHVA